jgi:hypothetical protein
VYLVLAVIAAQAETNIWFVIPAKAGIHLDLLGRIRSKMDSRFRGNDDSLETMATGPKGFNPA